MMFSMIPKDLPQFSIQSQCFLSLLFTHSQVIFTHSSFPHTIVLVDHLDQVIQSWQCGGLWESGAQLSFGRLMVSC